MNHQSYLLKAGMHVHWQGCSYRIRVMEPDIAVLEKEDRTKTMLNPNILFKDYAEGDLVLEQPKLPVVYQPLSKPEHHEAAELIKNYLLPLDTESTPCSRETIKKVIERVAKKHCYVGEQVPSDSKVYRWYGKWVEHSRNIIPLVIKPMKKRKKQIDECVYALAAEVIWDEYMKINGRNRLQTIHAYQERHRQEFPKLRMISESRFYELFQELNPVDVVLAREGHDAARRLKRTNKDLFVAEFVMERIEIDAVHLKIGILDPETGAFIGSPVVYLAIDVYTRYIVGYSVSFGRGGKELSAAVIECLKHMVSPKQGIKTKKTWECLGVPRYVACDAGPAFRANVVTSFLAQIKCDHHVTETASPWKKPFIERFNRTLRSQLASKIPGYVGRRADGKQYDQTMEQMATINSDQFIEYLEEYIVDIYHQNPHRGLQGWSPAQAVEEAMKKLRPSIVADQKALEAFGGEEFEPTLQKYSGIQKNNLFYQSDELRNLYNMLASKPGKKNSKVTALYNPHDISQISVIDPDTFELIIVPCTDSSIQEGMYLAQYQANQNPDQKGHHKVFTLKESDPKTCADSAKTDATPTSSNTSRLAEISGSQSAEQLDLLMLGGQKRIARGHSDKSIKSSKSKSKSRSTESKAKRKSSTGVSPS